MTVGMNHQFVLVPSSEVSDDYDSYAGKKRYLLNDDFISVVIASSLQWISTRLIGHDEGCLGLNPYGITLIEKKGAEVAKKVFKAWRDLVSAAPEQLSFHCGFSQDAEGNMVPFNPEFQKSELIENLNGIISYLEQVGDEYSLVHLGI